MKVRKSPEGSSTSTVPDSGFSTEKDISGGGGGTLLSPAGGQVRWPQELRMASLSSSPPPDSDELLGLLDVIHRKAVKLRAQQIVEAEWGQGAHALSKNSRTLGAIHEHEAVASDSSDNDTKDRTRTQRKLFSDSSGSGAGSHDHLVDRISELENEALSSNFKVSKLESEISRISRQKELLEEQLKAAVSIKSELDSKIHDMHSQYVRSSKKEGAGGIIHSVQILTGGGFTNQSLGSGDYVLSPSRSETNLRKVGDNGSVNIEIRGGAGGGQELSRSQEALLRYPKSAHNTVVNLRSSQEKLGRSVDGLNALFRQRTDSSGAHHLRPSNSRFFQNRMTGPPNVHKLPPQLNRVLSNDKLSPKSRSVENLSDQRQLSERLKSANSEISLQPRPLYLDQQRLKSTMSEQVLTKIGRTEKVRLDQVMSSSVVSMPAELAKTMVRSVKPNREKIRQVLGTNSVLELQRQLLTTVMENEVRIIDGKAELSIWCLMLSTSKSQVSVISFYKNQTVKTRYCCSGVDFSDQIIVACADTCSTLPGNNDFAFNLD